MKRQKKRSSLDINPREVAEEYIMNTSACEVIDIFITHVLYAFVKGTSGYHVLIEESVTFYENNGLEIFIIGKKEDITNSGAYTLVTFPIDSFHDSNLYDILDSMRISMYESTLSVFAFELEEAQIETGLDVDSINFSDQDIINICKIAASNVVFWVSPCRGNSNRSWNVPWLYSFLNLSHLNHNKRSRKFPILSHNRKMEYADQIRKRLRKAVECKISPSQASIDDYILGYPEDDDDIDEQYDPLDEDDYYLSKQRYIKLTEEPKQKEETPIEASFRGALFTSTDIEETEI